MSRPMRRLVVAAATAASLVASAEPQTPPQPPPQATFPTGTELVTVDVVVTGKDGQPVTGLRREDFAVSEDGVPQEIASFEAVHRPAPASEGGESAPALPALRSASNHVVPGREPASFVVVFDELHLSPDEAVRARQAVSAFLKTGVVAGDRVGLVGTFDGTRLAARMPEGRAALVLALDRFQGRRVRDRVRDYMSEYEAMRIDQDRDPIVTDQVMRRLLSTGEIRQDVATPGNPVDTRSEIESWRGQTQALAAPVWGRARMRLEQTLGIVERSLQALASARGRKSLVLVSSGLVRDPRSPGLRRAVNESRRANAAIYSLDARGLVAALSGLQADVAQPLDILDRSTGAGLGETADASEGSEGLALDTGGFVIRNQNDLASGLERIGSEARSYYLVGYTPTNRAADGRFRTISVRVARPGAAVRARRGYYAPGRDDSAGKPEGRDAAMQRALDAPFDLPELPLRAIAHSFAGAAPGKTTVRLTLEADVRGLAFVEQGETARDTLELLLLVAQRETGEFTRFDQQLELSLRPETRARYDETGFPITRELALAPGPYQARIVARDKNSGRVGSLTYDFEVGAASGLRVSSLVLSDRQRESEGESRAPEIVARRTFAAASVLHCRFEVYGAAKDPASGRPQLTAGFALRRANGRVLAAAAETAMQPGPDGSLARSLGVPLDGVPPGAYEVIVVVTDLVAGQTAEAREPILVVAGPQG